MDKHRRKHIHGGNLHAPGEPEYAVSRRGAGPIDVSNAQPPAGLRSLWQRAHEYALASGGADYAGVRQAYLDGWLAHARVSHAKTVAK